LVPVALDFDASLSTLRDPRIATSRVLHIATHGVLNADRPDLSGVLLSLVDREGRPQQGFFSAADAARLQLATELVVLSGCRTALGREVNGEGIVGLTRGFLYAGAARVMASLWKIDDAATAGLMRRLYRGLLGAPRQSPAAALRSAQLALLRQPAYRHPYYWAGFQLYGEVN
jgi:CHAT domain-containing protein